MRDEQERCARIRSSPGNCDETREIGAVQQGNSTLLNGSNRKFSSRSIAIAQNDANFNKLLNLDLSFQNFAQELEHFENEYSPPSGAFLLAQEKGTFVGCVGLRKLSDTVGEIKRLYVEPTARGLGLGQALVRGIVDEGRQLKYTRLVLDTLPSMLAARSLYQALGFKPVAPYRYNPVSGTAFLELRLHDQGAV